MKLFSLLFLLLLIAGGARATQRTVSSGAASDLVTMWNTTMSNFDTLAVSNGPYNLGPATTLSPKRGVYIYAVGGSAKNHPVVISSAPNGSGYSIISLADTGATIKGFAIAWRETTVAPTGYCYLFEQNSKKSAYLRDDSLRMSRSGLAGGYIRGTDLENIGSKATPTYLLFDSCYFDSSNASYSAYDAQLGGCAKITNCLFYKSSFSAGFRGLVKNCWAYQNNNNKGADQKGLWASYDTILHNFCLSDSCVAECISASSSSKMDTGCLVANNYIYRNAHECFMADTQRDLVAYGNIFTETNGSPTYNHCNGGTDSCWLTHSLYKTSAATADVNWSGGSLPLAYNKFLTSIFWISQTSSQAINFSAGSIGDTVGSSAMMTPLTYPTITNGYFRSDTIHTDSMLCFSERTLYFYPRQKSTNRLITIGAAGNPRTNDSIWGPKRYLNNRMDTTGTANVTAKHFSIVDSVDYNFRAGDYSFNFNNHWFTGDTVMAYLQDSTSANNWRNVDSQKILAGHKYTFTDSASGISGKKVSHRIWSRSLVTQWTANLGAASFNDTAFLAQDSITIPSGALLCTLTVNTTTGGNVSVSQIIDSTDHNVFTATATPNTHYRLVNWTASNGNAVPDISTTSTTTWTMSGSSTVTANFIIYPQYTATISTTGSGNTTPSTGLVDSSIVYTLTNTPNSGNAFKIFSVAGGAALGSSVTTNPNTFYLSSAGSITATDTFTVPTGMVIGATNPKYRIVTATVATNPQLVLVNKDSIASYRSMRFSDTLYKTTYPYFITDSSFHTCSTWVQLPTTPSVGTKFRINYGGTLPDSQQPWLVGMSNAFRQKTRGAKGEFSLNAQVDWYIDTTTGSYSSCTISGLSPDSNRFIACYGGSTNELSHGFCTTGVRRIAIFDTSMSLIARRQVFSIAKDSVGGSTVDCRNGTMTSFSFGGLWYLWFVTCGQYDSGNLGNIYTNFSTDTGKTFSPTVRIGTTGHDLCVYGNMSYLSNGWLLDVFYDMTNSTLMRATWKNLPSQTPDTATIYDSIGNNGYAINECCTIELKDTDGIKRGRVLLIGRTLPGTPPQYSIKRMLYSTNYGNSFDTNCALCFFEPNYGSTPSGYSDQPGNLCRINGDLIFVDGYTNGAAWRCINEKYPLASTSWISLPMFGQYASQVGRLYPDVVQLKNGTGIATLCTNEHSPDISSIYAVACSFTPHQFYASLFTPGRPSISPDSFYFHWANPVASSPYIYSSDSINGYNNPLIMEFDFREYYGDAYSENAFGTYNDMLGIAPFSNVALACKNGDAYTTGITCADGVWHHVKWIWRSDTMQGFLDGVKVISKGAGTGSGITQKSLASLFLESAASYSPYVDVRNYFVRPYSASVPVTTLGAEQKAPSGGGIGFGGSLVIGIGIFGIGAWGVSRLIRK